VSTSRAALTVIVFACSALLQQEALAWGATGHRMISRMAINSLPSEIPAFLRTSKSADMIGELGREPDRSKGTGDSHDHDLDPGHYVNLSDEFAAGGGLPLDALPETREDYDTALRRFGTNEYRVGFLPYSIIDGWQQLKKDFAYWRADVAGERAAIPKADRAWFTRDRRLRELVILRLGLLEPFCCRCQPAHACLCPLRHLGRFPQPTWV